MMRLITILFCLLPLLSTAQFPLSGMERKAESPDQIDSLFYWFDATDATTITTNNNKVTQWDDKSPNGYDVVQADTSKAPTYSATSGPGGSTAAMTFDGSDDFLASAAHWWGSDDLTVIVVMKFANATRDATEYILGKYLTTTTDRQWALNGRDNTASENYNMDIVLAKDGGGSNYTRYSQPPKSSSYKLICDVNNSGVSRYMDGSIEATLDRSVGTGDDSIHDASIELSIGCVNASTTPVGFLQGSMSEIIVYSRALTSTERGKVEAYLSAKYNLSLENEYVNRDDVYRIPPNYIDSLEYHFDASTGVLDSVGGAIATDEGVGTWQDQSPNATNATQATNGARPVYKATGGANSTPCIQFDGSNDFLATTGEYWGSDDFTIFAVYNHLNASANQDETILAKYETSTDDRQILLYARDNSTTPTYRTQLNWSGLGTSASVRQIWTQSQKSTSFKIHTFLKAPSDSDPSWYENDRKLITDDGALITSDIYDATQPLSIGAINPTGTPGSFLGGCICELIVYSRELKAREKEGIWNWLNNKYSLW